MDLTSGHLTANFQFHFRSFISLWQRRQQEVMHLLVRSAF